MKKSTSGLVIGGLMVIGIITVGYKAHKKRKLNNENDSEMIDITTDGESEEHIEK